MITKDDMCSIGFEHDPEYSGKHFFGEQYFNQKCRIGIWSTKQNMITIMTKNSDGTSSPSFGGVVKNIEQLKTVLDEQGITYNRQNLSIER